MIELIGRQLDFGDGVIAEEVGELWEDWMRHVDTVFYATTCSSVPLVD